jgi:hypothetical protein
MATISTAALFDSLPTSVSKLEVSRLNWAIFLIHFCDAIDAKGFWGHFNGSTSVSSMLTPATAKTAAKGQWDKDE